jgi:hypothetical protein
MTRDGYVFLGARDERSTTHPERDFYIHFLSLFKQNGKKDAPKEDEVFLLLTSLDDLFLQNLRLYAGAREMAAISSGSNKTQYERKAEQFLSMITRWLRENFVHAFEIRHGKASHRVADGWGEFRLAKAETNLRDQTYQLTSEILNEHFQDRYRDYPSFGRIQLTQLSLPQACQAALRAVAGGPLNQQAQSILEGLKLIQLGESQSAYRVPGSRYASNILSRLDLLGVGRVLNRKELIGADPDRERELKFGLEPELLVVVLAALLRQGEITLNWMGRTFTSDDLDEVARIDVGDLAHFSTIARPKPVPEQSLKELFEGLGLPEEWVSNPSQHERAAQEVSRLAETELPRLVMALDNLREGLHYLSEGIFSNEETQTWRKALEGYRELLQFLERLNTPGRLRQFSLSVSEVRTKLKGRDILHKLSQMRELLQALQSNLNYIARAELRLPAGHPWQTEANRLRHEQTGWLRDPKIRSDPSLYARLNGGLGNLRSTYIEAYFLLHQTARLDRAGDERKRSLTQDPRWRQLLALQDVSILPESEFRRLQQTFNDSLRACPVLTKEDLHQHTECPHCGFDPRSESGKKPVYETLEAVFQELDRLYTSWLMRLREELQKPEVNEDVTLLKSPYREQIQSFISDGKLPASISQNFVKSVNDALQGLEKMVLNGTEFLLALTQAGMPCTVEELYQRMEELVQNRLGEKNLDKVRIELDW